MAKILIVDDEQLIRKLIGDCLKKEGHEVLEAENGEIALKLFEANKDLELALLDIMMPEVDGWEVCRKIREKSDMPVMLVSARSQDFDQIMGFESGADDYVTKPFNPLELCARVKSQIRRYCSLGSLEKKDGVITSGGLSIDINAHEVTVDGEIIKLTATEYGIVEHLMKNLGRILSTDQIYEAVWGDTAIAGDKTVTVHIRRIREKIEINPKEPKYLKVVWGIGYKIEKL
jgi:DNA-binding response OmpR family regulator